MVMVRGLVNRLTPFQVDSGILGGDELGSLPSVPTSYSVSRVGV